MIVIGEKINGAIPRVAAAIQERDGQTIKELALLQVKAGADYLDVCAGSIPQKEYDDLAWLVDTVQECTDVPICIDSPDPLLLKKILPRIQKPGMINSISGEGEKCETMFPILVSCGVNPITAAAAIALSQGVDWGPGDMGSGICLPVTAPDVVLSDYFMNVNLIAAIPMILITAVVAPLVYRYFDKKEGLLGAAANCFAKAISSIGGFEILTDLVASTGFSPVILLGIIGILGCLTVVVSSSYNTAAYTFGPSVASVAASYGLSAAVCTLPLQMIIGFGRILSPINASHLLIAGTAKVDILKLIKRNVLPVAVAYIVTMIVFAVLM